MVTVAEETQLLRLILLDYFLTVFRVLLGVKAEVAGSAAAGVWMLEIGYLVE